MVGSRAGTGRRAAATAPVALAVAAVLRVLLEGGRCVLSVSAVVLAGGGVAVVDVGGAQGVVGVVAGGAEG